MAGDIYDGWGSVMRQWDTTYSIRNIESFTKPGHYSFLDQMVLGDVPGRKGSAFGPGLSHDEAVAHMSMWVMAASPLVTCTDVRNMTTDIKSILTNPEVLAVHKDTLARMATRVDVGGGDHELHSADICAASFPACQEHPGDRGYPGHPCTTCRYNDSVWEKPLSDGSSAVMVLNRGETPLTVIVDLYDLGDSTESTWAARDLWDHTDLRVFSRSMAVSVPAHGVRLLRMRPQVPSPPTPPQACPAGFSTHAPGLWSNPQPCGHYPAPANCTATDTANGTAVLCGKKCKATEGCLAFEVFQGSPATCHTFVGSLAPPFTPEPAAACLTCVVETPLATTVTTSAPREKKQTTTPTSGFQVGNGTFLLNGSPIRLFTGSLQHFRIHPQHWEHRLALAKAMGLNAVQTLTPWMMMEPTPGEFKTDGFLDIVRFAKLAQAAGLLIVLRPGPFICDGPDNGGLPWWLNQQNSNTTGDGSAYQLRIRTADPSFMRRVGIFTTKLFALLRSEQLTADLGGPIVMAQIENEYGLFASEHVYLEQLRDMWRAGLGDGVVIHSTDPASSRVLGGSRISGVLQTIDFGVGPDPAGYFDVLKASQRLTSDVPQPLMCSEIYPGNLNYWGDPKFLQSSINPVSVASSIDTLLDTDHCQGSTSFALWLFASCTDFGFWGGTLFLGEWKALVPSYDFGAPIDEAGVIRPLFYLLRDVLTKHGAAVPTGPLPAQPPVKAYGSVAMAEAVTLWDALPALQPHPVASPTVRSMEELGQGYGFVLYTAPIPAFQTSTSPSIIMGGMRDRAQLFLNHAPRQTCGRPLGEVSVDDVACGAALPWSGPGLPEQLDILVENLGRPTGGVEDAELSFRGIDRWVSVNSQSIGNWSISTLPLDNIAALAPVWKPVTKAVSGASGTPTFFRGTFSIPPGGLADTFLTLRDWGKGQAWVNGNNLARYWSSWGPQYSFYCPAGWLVEGVNEVVLLEQSGAPVDLTVEFRAAHYQPPPTPPQACPAGFSTHAPGLWSNPQPCGHYPAPANCTATDTANGTAVLCGKKCKATEGCLAFEVFQGSPATCHTFVGSLAPPFTPEPAAACLTCVLNTTTAAKGAMR